MRTIALDDEILEGPAVHIAIPPRAVRDLQAREVARLPLQLLLERLHVVAVHVRVAHDVRQAARDQVARVRHHVRQQRVARDVERHAEAHVAGALVELAVEVALLRFLFFFCVFLLPVLPFVLLLGFLLLLLLL